MRFKPKHAAASHQNFLFLLIFGPSVGAENDEGSQRIKETDMHDEAIYKIYSFAALQYSEGLRRKRRDLSDDDNM